jgi:hypothetical protein
MDLRNWEFSVLGTAIVGANVYVYAADTAHPNPNAAISSTTTDSNGMWSFTGLTEAAKDVKVTYNGRDKWYKGLSRHSVGISAPYVGTLTTAGDLLKGTGSGAVDRVAIGTYRQVLRVNSGATAPEWGGAMVLIGEVSGDGSSATVEFSSIPATYRNLMLMFMGRTTDASSSQRVDITFESSPTAGAYNYQSLYASGASPGSGSSYSVSAIYVGNLTGTTGVANACGVSTIFIPEYANTNFFKIVQAFNLEVDSAFSDGNFWIQTAMGMYESTSAIDRIRLTLGSGNWASGSRVTLYGIPA